MRRNLGLRRGHMAMHEQHSLTFVVGTSSSALRAFSRLLGCSRRSAVSGLRSVGPSCVWSSSVSGSPAPFRPSWGHTVKKAPFRQDHWSNVVHHIKGSPNVGWQVRRATHAT